MSRALFARVYCAVACVHLKRVCSGIVFRFRTSRKRARLLRVYRHGSHTGNQTPTVVLHEHSYVYAGEDGDYYNDDTHMRAKLIDKRHPRPLSMPTLPSPMRLSNIKDMSVVNSVVGADSFRYNNTPVCVVFVCSIHPPYTNTLDLYDGDVY
jgi:hypothetical protein